MTGPTHAPYRVLVMAKAPVPGLAKTRLAATVGERAAAEVAAAALLDTIAAAAGAVGETGCVLALAGDLDQGVAADELRAALRGWLVLPQRGDGFDDRLARAHAAAGDGPLLQVGMDTPQLTADLLDDAAARLADADTVLGRATDGGWWVLGRTDAAHTAALRGVEMSTPTTYDDTRAALEAAGASVAGTAALRDVDDAADADEVARLAPTTRFARAWTALTVVGR